MKKIVTALTITLSILIVFTSGCKNNELNNEISSGGQVKSTAFTKLAAIKESKKQEIMTYFSVMKDKATKAGSDKDLINIFKHIQAGTDDLKLDEKYVNDYGEFYDILLVDNSGLVFSSVKKESDYMRNIFKDDFFIEIDEDLSRDNVTFVDYQKYKPSLESAAFFIVPIKVNDLFAGWIILQCSMNTVNLIFTDRDNLGRTGEVYLINKDRLLMTESRFINENSALNIRIDTEAAQSAIQFEQGERIIEDYRGVRVYSSFAQFEVFGATWVIIAEMDESEILTTAFIDSGQEIFPAVVTQMQKFMLHDLTIPRLPHEGIVVDVNEFHRTTGEKMRTYGVATCSSLVIQFPQRFAYLAHISPTDNIYAPSSESGQNFISGLLRRINYFELLPVEKREVQFIFVAPHTASFEGAIETILENGYDLANIRIMINETARGANIFFKPFEQLQIEWYGKTKSIRQDAFKFPSLQELFTRTINYQ